MKWKKPSRPEGVAVWMHGGNLCMADVLKKAVRLTFPNGAALTDPAGLFNTRLDSKSVRAIDSLEGDVIDEGALQALIVQAFGRRPRAAARRHRVRLGSSQTWSARGTFSGTMSSSGSRTTPLVRLGQRTPSISSPPHRPTNVGDTVVAVKKRSRKR